MDGQIRHVETTSDDTARQAAEAIDAMDPDDHVPPPGHEVTNTTGWERLSRRGQNLWRGAAATVAIAYLAVFVVFIL